MRKEVERGIGKQSQNLVPEENGGTHHGGEGISPSGSFAAASRAAILDWN